MNQTFVKITNQLSDKQKNQVANLYYQAFIPKFSTLWLFTSNQKEAVQVLKKSLAYDNGLYAIDENEQVLGFVGLEERKDYFTILTYKSLRKAYSIFSATWRFIAYGIYRIFHGAVKKNSLHVDPIVVSEHARGMGIGTKLFDAVFEKAKKEGFSKVILEVVDTNPQAQKLYERIGFRVYKVDKLGLLTRDAGFEKVHCMEKYI